MLCVSQTCVQTECRVNFEGTVNGKTQVEMKSCDMMTDDNMFQTHVGDLFEKPVES